MLNVRLKRTLAISFRASSRPPTSPKKSRALYIDLECKIPVELAVIQTPFT